MKGLAALLSHAFAEISIATLHGAPSPAEALRRMAAPRIHLVPLLAAAGQIGRALRLDDARLQQHPPLGQHPCLSAVIDRLVDRVVTAHRLDRRQTAVVLLGHGNPRDRAPTTALRRLAEGVAACEVRCLFLTDPPQPGDWPELPEVIVVPCLFSAGRHLREDVPNLLEAMQPIMAARGQRLWATPSLGSQAGLLAPLILGMVEED